MTPAAEAAAPGRRAVILTSCGLVVLVFGLYARVLGHDFVYLDDHTYVLKNPHLAGGISASALGWCFNAGYASNWHPLTWMSHLLDVTLFGLKPAGHHLGNVLLHAASSVLVFLLLRRLSTAAGRHSPRTAFGASLFVALAFAVQPQHVESVAWVSERKDALSTFLWLVTLHAYARYAARPGLARYLLVSACFVLGLMAKPMVVTLPFTLLLVDVWPLGRVRFASPRDREAWRQVGRCVREKLPWFLLSLGSAAITVVAQGRGGAIGSLEAVSMGARLGNALAALATYVGGFFWPWPMAVFYPYPASGPAAARVAVGALLLIGATVTAFLQLARRPWISVGWLWFLVTLAPVIGLVQVGEQSHADRYTYVPHLGLALALGFGFAAQRGRATAAGVLLVLVWIGMTWRQVGTWRDSRTLFEHAIAVTEGNHKAHNNLGAFLADRGQLEQAGAHFRQAVEANPRNAESLINYGKYLRQTGRGEQARQLWTRHVQAVPDDLRVRRELARLVLENGSHLEAAAHYTVLQEARPEDGETAYSLGVCKMELGEDQAAIAAFERAATLGFEPARSHRLMAFCSHRMGNVEQAIRHYRTALDLDPRERQSAFNLGILFERQGQTADAEAAYRHALTISPDWFEARLALGNLLWSRGDAEAIPVLERAVSLAPDRAEGRFALGRAYHSAGQEEKAAAELQALRKLDAEGARGLEVILRDGR